LADPGSPIYMPSASSGCHIVDSMILASVGRSRRSHIYVLGPCLSSIIDEAWPMPADPSYGGFNTVGHSQPIQDIMLGEALYELSMISAIAGQPIITR
jgi:hypothetical protein